MLPAAEFFHLLQEGIKNRQLLPLGGYFPISSPSRRASILFLGNNRDEVKARRKEWGRRLRKMHRPGGDFGDEIIFAKLTRIP
jgi:hypothetical protein